MKLNLGCGKVRKEGFVNIDSRADSAADMVVDLMHFPWPFEDASIEEIHADAFFEHLKDWEDVLLECARVLRPGGLLRIYVPYGPWGLSRSPYHYRAFADTTFDAFISGSSGSAEFSEPLFEMVSRSHIHFYPFAWHLAQRFGERMYRLPLGHAVNILFVLRRLPPNRSSPSGSSAAGT